MAGQQFLEPSSRLPHQASEKNVRPCTRPSWWRCLQVGHRSRTRGHAWAFPRPSRPLTLSLFSAKPAAAAAVPTEKKRMPNRVVVDDALNDDNSVVALSEAKVRVPSNHEPPDVAGGRRHP